MTEALGALRRRLANAGYELEDATIGGRDALVARRASFRLQWIGTRLHTFVVVLHAPELSDGLAESLTAAAQQYAIDHKGGLPRGLQTGTATVAVFLAETAEPAVRAWFLRKPKHRFAALRLPVLVEVGPSEVTYFRKLQNVGSTYHRHLRALVDDVIAPV